MTHATGNSNPQVIEGIKHATDLASKGETESAINHLSTLIEKFPAAASLHSYVALFLSRAARFEEAIGFRQKAILLSPKSEKASLIIYSALWTAGRHIEALDEMKRFVALSPAKEYTRMIKEWNLNENEPVS